MRGTFCDPARDGCESPNADTSRNRCQAFDARVPLNCAESLHIVEIPEMLKCALCFLSIFCNFKLKFLDSLNSIVDRRWGEVVLEDGLDECKRFSVTRECVVVDDGRGIFAVEPFINTFLGSLQRLRQLL